MSKIWTREDYHKIIAGGILGRDKCPFCEPNLDREMVIWEGENWRIFTNKYPYTGTDEHIMAVPKNHKKFSTEFSSDEWSEMHEIHNFVKNFYGDQLYFSFTRENFDLENADGRSVEHWHMHFLPGSLKWKYLRKMLELQGFPVEQDIDFEKEKKKFLEKQAKKNEKQ